MTLSNIVNNFRFNPTTTTAMSLARYLAKYPHLASRVSKHTKQRAVSCLSESSDRLHHPFVNFLK